MEYFKLTVFPIVFILLLCWEQVNPLRKKTRPLMQRLFVNLILTGIVIISIGLGHLVNYFKEEAFYRLD